MSITNEAKANNRASFDFDIKESLGDSITITPMKPQRESMDPNNNFVYYSDDEQAFIKIVPEADAVDSKGSPIKQTLVADLLINAEVLLPNGDSQHMAKVIRRTIDENGKVIVIFDKNPLLNKLVYDV